MKISTARSTAIAVSSDHDIRRLINLGHTPQLPCVYLKYEGKRTEVNDNAAGDAGSFFDDSDAHDGERTKPRQTAVETPHNLTLYRWRRETLSAGEESDLVRAAQGGDRGAEGRLVECFHRLVLKIAEEYSGASRDDLIAAGCEGLLVAIRRYSLRRNNRLGAYAKHWIRKYISEAVRDWRKAGDGSDTRADRYLYNNPNATAEELVAKLNLKTFTVTDAELAIQRAAAKRSGHDPYSTTDDYYEDDGDDGERYIGPRPASSHEMYRMYDCFSPYQLSPQLRLYGKPLGQQGAGGISCQIDQSAIFSERTAVARLRLMGRRKFAEWLERREQRIAKDRKALQETNHWLYGNLYRCR